jgi:tetratricopeptide (TPR) repeat protein
MINTLEVTTVKARQRHSRSVAGIFVGLVVAGGSAFGSLGAQQTLRRGETAGPRFMVPILRSTEPNLGVQAAEAIRDKMAGDIPLKNLWVIPKSDIVNTLEASGYSVRDALNANDTRALATLLRAEEFVEGTVSKTPTGFRIDANIQLVRGDGMVQPLPPVEAPKLDKAADKLSDEIQEARKQVEPAGKCMLMQRQQKYGEATKAAGEALKAYPRSTMARVCLLEIYNGQKLGADSIIKEAEEVLAIHPQNKRALALVADAYNEKHLDDKYIQALTTLLAADPTNIRLQQTVVNALGAAKKPELAKPIIDEAVKQNPGDPSLIRLQYQVYLALKDYKGAATVGEEMVKTDTAAADTAFFARLSGAYLLAGDTAKAAEAVARGVAKFPKNTNLVLTLAQLQRQSGQVQQSIETLHKLLAIDPKADGVWLQIARAQMDMNAPTDSILASLSHAKAAGDSLSTVGVYALGLGQNLYKKANASKAVPDYQEAIHVLAMADSLAPSPQAKFLMGATNLSMGNALLQEASKEKSCEMAKQAQAALTDAQIQLPEGGKFNPQAAQQALGQLTTLSEYPPKMIKAYCK